MRSLLIGTMAVALLSINACSQNTSTQVDQQQVTPAASASAKTTNIRYRDMRVPAGAQPENAFDLDLYYRPGSEGQRVVVFVHGGGWMRGDKANIQKNPAIIDFFLRNGCMVASVNFRLPQRQSPGTTTYKDQADDIAASIRWLSENAQRYGGNPTDIVLFGYSSGAHLAALVATDERYLARQGLPIDLLKGAILMDVHTYDIPSAIASMRRSPVARRIPMIEFLFGRTAAEQAEASPANYASRPGKVPFLIVSAGIKDGDSQGVSKANSAAFKSKLAQSGHKATHEHFRSKSHLSLVMEFGNDSDPVTKAVARFLNGLKTSSLDRPTFADRIAALFQKGKPLFSRFRPSNREIVGNVTG